MFVTVNGTRLFFDVEGAGLLPDGPRMRQKPTLIMVHGGPGADHSHLKPAWSQLADIAQLIFYDHRGNGRSDLSTPDTWTLAQWGDDLRGLIDALGVVHPIVCGISFGGFVVQSYATRHPGHAGKLILISTAAKMEFEAVFRMFGSLGGPRAEAVARAYWNRPTQELRDEYRDVCVPLYRFKPDLSQDWLARTTGPADTALHFNGAKNEQGRMDFRADLGRVRVPVLVMGGEQDPITPIGFSETIADSLPPGRVRFLRFAACGHGVVDDRPGAAFAAIRKFIAE